MAGPQGTINYEYDEDSGLLTKQTLPNGIFTLYQYNNRGQMSGMAHYQPGDPDVLLAEYSDITYDAAGRRTGFSAQIAALPDYSDSYTFTYNAKGELTGEECIPDDQLLPPVERDYSYSAAGNITDFNGTERRYNGANQLTQEWVNGQWETVADYDERGNLTEYHGWLFIDCFALLIKFVGNAA